MANNGLTKQDLTDALAQFGQRMDGKLADMRAALEKYFSDGLERLETKLLTEFHGYSERQHDRLISVEQDVRALRRQLDATADWVSKIDNEARFLKFELRLREIERRLGLSPNPGDQQ